MIQELYNTLIRPRLPRDSYRVCAGITVRDHPALDRTKRFPDYKQGLLSGISDSVNEGDRVILIGAGRGVSLVHTARSGASEIMAIDAAPSMLRQCEQTLSDNDTPDSATVTLRHALVGEAIEVYGDASDAEQIHPNELPECDVLVMDCEGAERSILKAMDSLPDRFVIETHPERGVPTGDVERLLREHGRTWERRQYEPETAHTGKRVLVAE